jgi:hypothetical protein
VGGFLLGLGASAILTLIQIGGVWLARKMPGIPSITIVNAGGLVKLMMGASLSIAIIHFFDINLLAYSLTFGVWVCFVLPLIAYFMVKQDCTTQQKIKNIGGKKRIIKIN